MRVSPNTIREIGSWRMRWVEHLTPCVETEGRRALGRPKCKWEGNIKIVSK